MLMKRLVIVLGGLENRVPFKGCLKGLYKGSTVGFYNLGGLITRIGFWCILYYIYIYIYILRNAHVSVDNY